MRSIRTKVSLINMIAIVVSVLLIGGVGVLFLRNEGEQGSDREMTLLCDSQRKSLNEYFKSIEQSVDMVARYAEEELNADQLLEGGVLGFQGDGAAMAGRDWQSVQQAKLDAYLEEYAKRVETVFSSAANYTTGVSTYYYCLNPEIASQYPGFLFTKIDTPTFEPHSVVEVFSYPMDDISHIGWYSQPLQLGRPSWMEPYFNLNLNVKMISYVTPIYKADTFIGVIGMDIGYDTLVSQIDSIRIFDTGYACLVDAEGMIVYHPHMEQGVQMENLVPAMAEATGNPETGKKDTYIFLYHLEGQEKKAVSTSLENGLRLMIMAPTSEISKDWHKLIQEFLILGVAIMLVFAFVTTLAMQRIIKPLRTLTAASQRIAEGDYDVKLEYNGNNEVGILTKSFQSLVDHLKVYISDLNSKAYKDALTHVKNKAAFEIQLDKIDDMLHSEEPDAEQTEFAIVMLDCNFLKIINDQYGHAQGDTYLRTGCMFICKLFAHSPVFRIGGDEFAVLLRGEDFQNRDALFKTFDEMVEKVNAEAEHPWEKVNISKGIAVYDKAVDANVESVFNRADEEMYEEKVRQKTLRTK